MMDYWVAFYEKEEVLASYIIDECPSEVVALSEALRKLYEESGENVWVTTFDRRIFISKLEDKLDETKK